MRGEDSGTIIPDKQEETSRSAHSRKGTRIQSVTMKKKPIQKDSGTPQPADSENIRPLQEPSDQHRQQYQDYMQSPSDDENENPACASKENDPSLSPSPVKLAPPLSPRKNAHGKRPLSDLTTSVDMDPFVSTEPEETNMDMDTTDGMTASERNIAANASSTRDNQPQDRDRYRDRDSSPQRKSPKLSLLNQGLAPNQRAENPVPCLRIYEDELGPASESRGPATVGSSSSNPLAEVDPVSSKSQHHHPLAILPSSSSSSNVLKKPASGSGSGSGSGPGSRKVSSGSGLKKGKPRIGIRRL